MMLNFAAYVFAMLAYYAVGYAFQFGAVAINAAPSNIGGVGVTEYLGKAGQGVTGLMHGDTSQFLTQLTGATLCAAYAFGFTFVVFKIPRRWKKRAPRCSDI